MRSIPLIENNTTSTVNKESVVKHHIGLNDPLIRKNSVSLNNQVINQNMVASPTYFTKNAGTVATLATVAKMQLAGRKKSVSKFHVILQEDMIYFTPVKGHRKSKIQANCDVPIETRDRFCLSECEIRKTDVPTPHGIEVVSINQQFAPRIDYFYLGFTDAHERELWWTQLIKICDEAPSQSIDLTSPPSSGSLFSSSLPTGSTKSSLTLRRSISKSSKKESSRFSTSKTIEQSSTPTPEKDTTFQSAESTLKHSKNGSIQQETDTILNKDSNNPNHLLYSHIDSTNASPSPSSPSLSPSGTIPVIPSKSSDKAKLGAQVETLLWLNVILSRFWISMEDSPVLLSKVACEVTKVANRKMNDHGIDSYLRDTTIHKVMIGSDPPKILTAEVETEEDGDITVDLEIEYGGGVIMDGSTIAMMAGQETVVNAEGTMKRCNGRMRIHIPKWPAERFWIAFLKEPDWDLDIQCSGTMYDKLAMLPGVGSVPKLIVKKIKNVLCEKFVLPNRRYIYIPGSVTTVEVTTHPSPDSLR